MDCKTRNHIIMKVTCYRCTNVLYKTEYFMSFDNFIFGWFLYWFLYVDENLKIIFWSDISQINRKTKS